MCSKCKVFGHNLANCPKNKAPQNVAPGMNTSPGVNRAPFAQASNLANITNNASNRDNFSRPGIAQPSWDGSTTINMKEAFCMKCKQKGHYLQDCPGFPKPGNSAGPGRVNNFRGNFLSKIGKFYI